MWLLVSHKVLSKSLIFTYQTVLYPLVGIGICQGVFSDNSSSASTEAESSVKAHGNQLLVFKTFNAFRSPWQLNFMFLGIISNFSVHFLFSFFGNQLLVTWSYMLRGSFLVDSHRNRRIPGVFYILQCVGKQWYQLNGSIRVHNWSMKMTWS